jgi:uncharacterized protein (DUF1015 family)
MATVKPFKCLHPAKGYFEQVAALPYDVYTREEARAQVQGKPWSFLNIDRPETQFPEEFDMYAPAVYEKAAQMLNSWEEQGILTEEQEPCYYIYTLTMDGREQNGIVGCCAVDDYLDGTIRKHEFTLAKKEEDRIRHVATTGAQTGPIFLAYRHREDLKSIIARIKQEEPLFSFVSEDGIGHAGWMVKDPAVNEQIRKAFCETPRTYIADGHHRCASAVKVALARREEHPDYTGEEEFNYFLSILFPDDELCILPYNRLVKDTNGLSTEKFLEEVGKRFLVEQCQEQVAPTQKGTFGMYLDDRWYLLRAKPELAGADAVAALDVSYLQKHFLEEILGIHDPKNDPRISFAGGIRGITYLEQRCHEDMRLAVSMYPTSIQELFAVADAELMMPPKSTWFEPKLRSGLFIHRF